MTHSDRLYTLANIVYKEHSECSFEEFFEFLSKLPDLQEEKLLNKSDAEILNLIIEYIRVFEKLYRFKNSSYRINRKEPMPTGTISFLNDQPEPPLNVEIDSPRSELSHIKTRKTEPKTAEKTLPRFFKEYYALNILGLVILAASYCSGNILYEQNFTTASLYALWAIIHCFIYLKCPQRSFTTAYITLTTISFGLSSFSLACNILTTSAYNATSTYAWPLAIKLYFCIALYRIAYKKTPIKHPFLSFVGICVSTIILISIAATGFSLLIMEDIEAIWGNYPGIGNSKTYTAEDVDAMLDDTPTRTSRYTLDDISSVRANMVSQTLYSGSYDSDYMQEEYRSGKIPHMLDDTVYYNGSASDE